MATVPLSQQRKTIMGGIGLAALATVALWWVLLRWLPPMTGADSFAVALQCSAVAALLTVVLGVEAVAHDRLFSSAIDPLVGYETPRLRVNFRYLSNTVEQYLVFAAGLLAFSAYVDARWIVAATIAWIASRWAFWVGYHISPLARAWGAPGMIQSMLILLYAGYRFGMDMFGPVGAALVVAPFMVIEAFLFRTSFRSPQ